jgi:hypothetical protein
VSDRHEIWELLDGLQMDIRAASGKLVALRSYVAGLDLPEPSTVTCPHCGRKLAGPRTLAEHLYNSHGGPVPDHYAATEAMALEPEPELASGEPEL